MCIRDRAGVRLRARFRAWPPRVRARARARWAWSIFSGGLGLVGPLWARARARAMAKLGSGSLG